MCEKKIPGQNKYFQGKENQKVVGKFKIHNNTIANIVDKRIISSSVITHIFTNYIFNIKFLNLQLI